MVNAQTLSGNWNDLKGKIRKQWGQLTNDDVQVFNGNVDQLVGMIQSKTGEARGAVERFLEEISNSGASGISQAAETVRGYATNVASQASDYAAQARDGATQAAGQIRDYAGQAASAIGQRSQQAAEYVRENYEQAEGTIRNRPTESVAICFGAGVLTGLLLALTFRSR